MCVDIFRRPDGSFGFELYRRDPEDPAGWYPAGHYSGARFADSGSAADAACRAVPWVGDA